MGRDKFEADERANADDNGLKAPPLSPARYEQLKRQWRASMCIIGSPTWNELGNVAFSVGKVEAPAAVETKYGTPPPAVVERLAREERLAQYRAAVTRTAIRKVVSLDSMTRRVDSIFKDRRKKPSGSQILDTLAVGRDMLQPGVRIGNVDLSQPINLVRGNPDFGGVCPIWTADSLVGHRAAPQDIIEDTAGYARSKVWAGGDTALDPYLTVESRTDLRNERERLIRRLSQAQQRFPQDAWITGQLVRFVFDQQDAERTVLAAKVCDDKQSWCRALLGLALEQAGRIEEAEASFRRAELLQAGSSRAPRCFDDETLLLLEPGSRSAVTRGSCDEQQRMLNNMWWLADPLWSIPGNERYVAHHARTTHLALRSFNDYDERFVWLMRGGGGALKETIVRYGWPSFTWWAGERMEPIMNQYRQRAPGHVWTPAPPYTIQQYTPDRVALIPNAAALRDPFSLNVAHWNLAPPDGSDVHSWWPQEHMRLRTPLVSLGSGQYATWRRDSTIEFEFAADGPRPWTDTSATGASAVMLVGGSAENNTRTLAMQTVESGTPVRIGTSIASTPVVMSAEVLPRSADEPAARARFGIRPPPTLREMNANEVALSVPTFLRMPDATASLPTSLADVRRLMAGTLSFARTESIAVYWESYGIAAGDTVQVELRVRRDDKVSTARRIGAALGVASGLRDSVSIKWTEPNPQVSSVALGGVKPVVGRSVRLNIAALIDGAYVVAIEMRKSGGVLARSEQRMNVR